MAREIPVCELTGRDGELVARFVAALATGGNADNGWLYDVGATVAVAIGAPDAHAPDSGAPADLIRVRARLLELVGAGIDERFLIRALRDEISRYLATLGHPDDDVDARRAEYRQDVEEALDGAAGFARFKDAYPEFAGATDDELHARLQHLLTVLTPVDANEAAEYWGAIERWNTLADTYLSDRDLDRWVGLSIGWH